MTPDLMQMLQRQHDLAAVQRHLLLFEVHPLDQVCEELPAIHIIYTSKHMR